MTRFVGADELTRVLPMPDAIDALDRAFASGRLPAAPPRSHVPVESGTLLLMPAHGDRGVGVKLVTVNPGNPEAGLPFVQAIYVLFDAGTLTPIAIIDGEALTGLRTGAVSGVATRHLARPDARTLVLFGAGTQAAAHLSAMTSVRPIERVVIVSRGRQRATVLAHVAADMGLDATVAAAAAVSEADIVCTCTTSSEPVFAGRLLRPGTHVNAVGAFEPHARELDDDAVRGSRIVVETRAAATGEAGDVVIPLAAGVIKDSDIVELADVASRRVARSPEDITIFKSVGVAFEDLVVAAAIRDRLD